MMTMTIIIVRFVRIFKTRLVMQLRFYMHHGYSTVFSCWSCLCEWQKFQGSCERSLL